MSHPILSLDDEDAVRILKTIIRNQADAEHKYLSLSTPETAALQSEFGADEFNLITDGEIARQALLILAQDPGMSDIITTMAQNPVKYKYAIDPLAGIALTTAVILVLKTAVEIEKDKEGKWTIKIKSKELDNDLLKGFVAKLLSWIPGGPFDKKPL